MARLTSYSSSQNDHLFFRHLAHAPWNAADSMTRLLSARKGHPIGAEGGVVVYHHRGCIQPLCSPKGGTDFFSEDARLESEWQAVGSLDRVVHLCVAIHTGHRAEHFLFRQLCFCRSIHDNCRADGSRREPLAARNYSRTLCGRLFNPGLNAVGFARQNERANFRFEQERVADTQFLNARRETVQEGVIDFNMNEDSLDRNAYLTSMVVTAFDQRFDSRIRSAVRSTITGATPPCSSAQRVPGASA